MAQPYIRAQPIRDYSRVKSIHVPIRKGIRPEEANRKIVTRDPEQFRQLCCRQRSTDHLDLAQSEDDVSLRPSTAAIFTELFSERREGVSFAKGAWALVTGDDATVREHEHRRLASCTRAS
jgi:hypothetical protein